MYNKTNYKLIKMFDSADTMQQVLDKTSAYYVITSSYVTPSFGQESFQDNQTFEKFKSPILTHI